MKKLVLLSLVLLTLFTGCISQENEKTTSGDDVLEAIQKLVSSSERGSRQYASNGILIGIYIKNAGDLYCFTYSDLQSLTALEKASFLNYWTNAEEPGSYLVFGNKEITLTKAKNAISAKTYLSSAVAAGTDVDNNFVIKADTIVKRNSHKANEMIKTASGDLSGNVKSFIDDPTLEWADGILCVGNYLYVCDSENHVIRRIDKNTKESIIFAGKLGESGKVDGTGVDAKFYYPTNLATDGVYLYLTDYGNYIIRKIRISDAEVTTLAGTGEAGYKDGKLLDAKFNGAYGITVYGSNIYFYEYLNNTIRKIDTVTGDVTTVAGTHEERGYIDSDNGLNAKFDGLKGITNDGTNLYVCDTDNCLIRKINIDSSKTTTLTGECKESKTTDGSLAVANFMAPYSIIMYGDNLYVSDTDDNVIRKIDIISGYVSTIGGKSGDSGSENGLYGTSTFMMPMGITCDSKNIYIVDSGNDLIRIME